MTLCFKWSEVLKFITRVSEDVNKQAYTLSIQEMGPTQ